MLSVRLVYSSRCSYRPRRDCSRSWGQVRETASRQKHRPSSKSLLTLPESHDQKMGKSRNWVKWYCSNLKRFCGPPCLRGKSFVGRNSPRRHREHGEELDQV